MQGMHKQADLKPVKQAVPNRLGELMRERGVRDVKVASHCDVDQSTVYRWRLRLSPIPDEQKQRAADFLGVSVPALMGWDCGQSHDGPVAA